MKPAVGGMPPSDSMEASIANAANGAQEGEPAEVLGSSPCTSVQRSMVMTAKAPSCMKA